MSSAARVSSSKGGAVGAILGCFGIRGITREWHALLSEAILHAWPALRSPVARFAARPPDVRSWRCSTSSDAGGRCASSGSSARPTPPSATLRTAATTCRRACCATGYATSRWPGSSSGGTGDIACPPTGASSWSCCVHSGSGHSGGPRAQTRLTAGTVADQVQEWAIEECVGDADTNWPRCPHHPDSHPLLASTANASAVWVCPTDQQVVRRSAACRYVP